VLRSQLLEKEREIKHLKVSDDETFLLLYLPRESLLRPISWLTTRASAHSSPRACCVMCARVLAFTSRTR
jgi:hypothetical protein